MTGVSSVSWLRTPPEPQNSSTTMRPSRWCRRRWASQAHLAHVCPAPCAVRNTSRCLFTQGGIFGAVSSSQEVLAALQDPLQLADAVAARLEIPQPTLQAVRVLWQGQPM